MKDKTNPSSSYSQYEQGRKGWYHIKWKSWNYVMGKHFVTIKLLNVITIRNHESTTNNVLQDQPMYYVNMHKSSIVTN
jgi:hypothetical protein